MARVGYARVSTNGQDLALQIRALKKAGCARIFEDKGQSGTKASRPALDEALHALEPGDVLVVYKLDRLGRSLKHLVSVIEDLHGRQVGFVSVTENLNTETPQGMLFFHVFAALGQFERDLIAERTKAGLEAAAASGKRLGRPALMTPEKIEKARKLLAGNVLKVGEIANRLNVSRTTLYKALGQSPDTENLLRRYPRQEPKKSHP